MLAQIPFVRNRFVVWWVALHALRSDAILYGVSALFAMGLAWTSREPAQWHWGYLAAAPYAAAAVGAYVLGRRVVRRTNLMRLLLLSLVVVGAVAIPLGLEARWRHLDHGVGFAQPEVSVIERAASNVSQGKDPYRTYVYNGHVVDAVRGLPAYESFFPYFPLMSLFGLPSAETRNGAALTDARIVMSLITLLISGCALSLLRVTREKKIRIAQLMLALPTGALFLATGGDDMPILALLLLGVVALERRSNYVAGVTLGLAAAMKLTAWPMAFGALLVARERDGRSAWRTVATPMALIVAFSIVPFAWRAPRAFLTNVLSFPLGLAGVRSPAASALPGHVLTGWWPPLGHVLAPAALLIVGYYVTKYVQRHWPLRLSELLAVLSAVFVIMILVASSTRIGYVIYPLNFALWSWVCSDQTARGSVDV